MLISLIVKNGENFKEIEEPSLTALGDLDWNDPYKISTNKIIVDYNIIRGVPRIFFPKP